MTSEEKNKFILEAKELTHTFSEDHRARVDVLRKVSFGVEPGEFFVILGPSGCGKSTLLRVLAGMVQPDHGEVIFSDEEMRRNAVMIFQSFALFPWFTVCENVAFGLKMRGVAGEKRDTLVREHIQEMGLVGFENVYPKDLSGGMKQRVGIARALACNPRLLLMDEPFSALDAFTADRLRKELLSLWMKDQMTNIMVTHLVDEAVEMADRILVMTPLPGRVEAIVPVRLPRPRNKRSPEFFALVDKLFEIVKV